MSYNSTQRQAESIDSNQQATKEQRQPNYHNEKLLSHAIENLGERSQLTQIGGGRVVDESLSGDWEDYEDFSESRRSNSTVGDSSCARLSDEFIYCEGCR